MPFQSNQMYVVKARGGFVENLSKTQVAQQSVTRVPNHIFDAYEFGHTQNWSLA
jgi:hypothetical protein